MLVKRAFNAFFFKIMYRPTVNGSVVNAGGISAFFGKFSRLVASVFHKARKRLFVEQRLTVFFKRSAVVYLVGKRFACVILQVIEYQFFLLVLRCKIKFHIRISLKR